MPQAPVYGGQKANIAAIPGFRQDVNRTAQEYGADFGGVVQAAGKLGEEVYVNQSITRSQNEANGARAKLSQSASVLMQRKGAAARGLAGEAEKAWQEEDARVKANLQGNEIALKAWEKQAPSMRESFLNPIRNHEADQVFAADTETKKLAIAGTQQEAARNYGTTAYESTKESLRLQAANLADHVGRDQKDAQLIAEQAVQGANSQAIDLALDAKNFPEAMKRFNALKDYIPPADRAKYEGILSVHANQQRVFDVGIVAAQAAVPKPPEKAGWSGQGPDMKEVTGEQYASDYAKYLHAPANELAAYTIIDEAIKNGELPPNQREEAVTQMRNYIKADADRRKAVVDSSYNELAQMVSRGATVAAVTQNEPSKFAVLSVEQQESLSVVEERAIKNRPSQMGAIADAYRMSPDQLIAAAPAMRAKLNAADWKTYEKLMEDALSGKRTADLVKQEEDAMKLVTARIMSDNGVKDPLKLDSEKMRAVEAVVRRQMDIARTSDKGTADWADPKMYTEVAKHAYTNHDDALTVRMMNDYSRRLSESQPLIDAFTAPKSENFGKAVENLKNWSKGVGERYDGKPHPGEAYSNALSVLTGMNFDQLQHERTVQQANDKAAGRVRTFAEIEAEIIDTAAARVKLAPTALGRTIEFVSDVPNIKEAFSLGASGVKSLYDFLNQPGLGAPPVIRR